jgi:uncharacterized Zn finger protein
VIPRKLAKAFLAEFLDELRSREAALGDALDAEGLDALVRDTLDGSTLVLRGSENAEQKARRYLAEGRIQVEREDAGGIVVATARGTEGVYRLGYDPGRSEWRCTCPSPGKKCAHLIALRLVVPPREATSDK